MNILHGICEGLCEQLRLRYAGYRFTPHLPGHLAGVGQCYNFVIHPPEAHFAIDDYGQSWVCREWCTQCCLVVILDAYVVVLESDGNRGWAEGSSTILGFKAETISWSDPTALEQLVTRIDIALARPGLLLHLGEDTDD